jgi:IclR family acetate operon transcriptional repressor
MPRSQPDRYRIPSLSKACQALRLMSDAGGVFTPSDLARQLAMPRTTAFRLLRTLVGEGLMEEQDGGYRLGVGMLRLALRTLEGIDVRGKSVPVLRELSQQSGETAHVAVLADDKALLVEVCDSPNPLRVASRAGSLVDLHCSSVGKIFLAWGTPEWRDSILDEIKLPQPNRGLQKSRTEFVQELEQIRTLGYALDDEEYLDGVRCLAVPVYDVAGRVVAAIGITGTTLRFTRGEIPRMIEVVRQAATDLSALLGYEGDQPVGRRKAAGQSPDTKKDSRAK